LLGLLPFLLLPLLAQGNSPIVWGNPTTIKGWWWLVSGAIYHPNQFAFTDFSVVAKAQEWVRIFATQISWAGYFLLLIGLVVAFQQRSDRYVRWQMAMLLATAVSILFYAFATNTIDSVVLTLPAILIICLLLVPALKLFKWFALALPLLLLLLNFSTMNLRHDPGIRPYAEQLLSDLPANAIVITDGDPALFALWYLHISEGQRPDIAIVDNHLFAFDWYRERLHQTYPDLIVPQADDFEKLQTEQVQERPFCHVNITAEAKPDIINSSAKH
jgi:hypothetical protein